MKENKEMKTKFNKWRVMAFGTTMALTAFMSITQAKAGFKDTIQEAELIPLNGAVVSNYAENKPQYFRFDVPSKIGNKWVVISLTNYTDVPQCISLLDNNGVEISDIKITSHNGGNEAIYTKISPSTDAYADRIKIKAGMAYFIKVKPYWGGLPKNDFNLSIKTIDDDNWGGFDNELKLKANKKQSGEIEVVNDVDSYSIKVPKKAECNFVINSDCDAKAYITDKDGIKLADANIYKGKADNSLSAVGNGEKVFIRIQSGNYNGKYTIKPCMASANLKLTKYKRGTAVIKGKTRGYADVKVYYNNKYYYVTSNANGNFAVNLDTKLKSKSKIEIIVSKQGQDSIVKNFKVK